MKIKLYSTSCPNCISVERMLKKESVDFELITDNQVILEVARKNKIMSAPFAEINGKILDYTEIIKYIRNRRKNVNTN